MTINDCSQIAAWLGAAVLVVDVVVYGWVRRRRTR